jgi:hypothetical protein
MKTRCFQKAGFSSAASVDIGGASAALAAKVNDPNHKQTKNAGRTNRDACLQST